MTAVYAFNQSNPQIAARHCGATLENTSCFGSSENSDLSNNNNIHSKQRWYQTSNQNAILIQSNENWHWGPSSRILDLFIFWFWVVDGSKAGKRLSPSNVSSPAAKSSLLTKRGSRTGVGLHHVYISWSIILSSKRPKPLSPPAACGLSNRTKFTLQYTSLCTPAWDAIPLW